MKKILNCGSLNIDYVYSVDHFVHAGETLSSETLESFCGGKGLNQSIALARAGAEVIHCGNTGEGDGRILVDMLKKNGVRTEHVLQKQTASGHAVIQVDKTGQNCILIFGGANQLFTEKQIEAALDSLSAGDFVLLQNETNANVFVLTQAKKRGLITVLNPSPMDEKLRALDLALLDYLILNEVEAAAVTGEHDPEKAEEALRTLFPHTTVVLTLGKRGAVYISATERIFCPSAPAQAVDTTAAGDTFTGYFFAGILADKTPSDSIKSATAAAALCITKKGAEPSIPQKTDVQDFLKKIAGTPGF